MKINVRRNKGFLLGITIVLVLGGFVAKELVLNRNHPSKNQAKNQTLRIAFPSQTLSSHYDPAKIFVAPEYIFLENIYSPLIEISPEGNLQSGIARRFEWKGPQEEEAHFLIRDDLKTIDGRPITAEDAAISLKRLLIQSGNTHGNIRDLLCPDQTLKSIEDPCDGIEMNGNTLILKPGQKKVFLFPMLAAIDFAVIPKESIDPKTLKILDYRNTSGPYYVSSDEGDGKITLEVNPTHYHYSEKIPQKVVFVPSFRDGQVKALQDFKNHAIDLITTVDVMKAYDLSEYAKNNPDVQLHMTLKIRTALLQFTPRGNARLSREKRVAIGKAVKQAMGDYFKGRDYDLTSEFFPVFGEGSLWDKQIQELQAFLSAIPMEKSGRDLKFGISLGMEDFYKEKLSPALPDMEFVNAKKQFLTSDQKTNSKETPDMFIITTDTGFLEDIGLLTYSINVGHLGETREAGREWLKKYMNIEDKAERLALLREFHLKTLLDSTIVPIAVAPYGALARKPWKIGLSKFYSNNQLWLITQD